MTKKIARAPRGDRLDYGSGKSKSSTTKIPKKPLCFNELTTLGEICRCYVEHGFYSNESRALNALLRGLR